jgi:maleylpyruvate isomerase
MREDGGIDEQEGAVTGEATTHSQDDEAVAGIELCVASHARLVATAHGLTDDVVAGPSLLPGWTVGHVLTHVARNADGHARRLDGALDGEEVPRYPGGQEERGADIEAGAPRSARDLAADVAEAAERLEDVWARSVAAGWPHRDLMADDRWPTPESPWRRLREVEVHHVDLDLGFEPEDWSASYVGIELRKAAMAWRARMPMGQTNLPAAALALPVEQRVAWLLGRREVDGLPPVEPWW